MSTIEPYDQQGKTRAKVLLHHLREVSHNKTCSDEFDILLTYASTVALTGGSDHPPDAMDLPGGLIKTDLQRFGACVTQMDPSAQKALYDALNSTLASISEFQMGGKASEKEASLLFAALPDTLEALYATIQAQHADNAERVERLEALVHDTNDVSAAAEQNHQNYVQLLADQHRLQTCAALRASLTDAITACPPLLRANQAAGNDLTSITVEICLIKLSLIRAEAHASLYGITSPTNAAAAMPQALSAAQSRMRADERRLVAEERAVDKELSEYTRLLEVVDGPGGGFAQVVEDWATIHKESEECRRDLRRLGWTGD